MSNQQELLERTIRRDQAIRASGNSPGPIVETQIVDMIVRQQTYTPIVRDWILSIAATDNGYVAEKLIQVVNQLLDTDFVKEAVRAFSSMLRMDIADSGRAYRKLIFANQKHNLAKVFRKDVLTEDRLAIWVEFLIQLQSQLLRDEAFAEAEENDERGADLPAIIANADRSAHYFFYNSPHSDRSDWGFVAKAVEASLAKCVAAEGATVFSHVAQRLIDSGWTIGVCEPLVAMYDHVSLNSCRRWQHELAIKLLHIPTVQASYGASVWRRLLRLALSAVLTPGEWDTIVSVIRASNENQNMRINELKDIEMHVILSSSEHAEIENAQNQNALFPPIDRRGLRERVVQPSFSADPTVGLPLSDWPFPEDHESLIFLAQSERARAKSPEQDREGKLFAKLQALNQIFNRDQFDSEFWFGKFLSWAFEALAELKKWSKDGHPLEANSKKKSVQSVNLMNQYAPWWEDRLTAALSRLALPVPPDHHTNEHESVYWSSDDPIASSIGYLDEVLATLEKELDAYKAVFIQTIGAAWSNWPNYTRCLATVLIRTSHWAQSTELRNLLTCSLTEERSSQTIQFSLDHLLRSGQPGVTVVLQSIMNRVESLSDPSEIAYFVGGVVGNAVVRFAGDQESDSELRQLNDWYHKIIASRSIGGIVRRSLVLSIVDSAEQHLRSRAQLQSPHVEAWDQLVNWSLVEWLGLDAGTQFDMPTSPINAIIEINWTASQRLKLLSNLKEIIARMLNEADLSGFYHLHVEFERLGRAHESDPINFPLFPQETLVSFCSDSATRVASWIREQKTTNDYAYRLSLIGDSTRRLILIAMDNCVDSEQLRYQLAPVIDILADVGLRDTASQLRTKLRGIA